MKQKCLFAGAATLLILLSIFVVRSTTDFFGSETTTPELSTELEREDWAVYLAGCFLFQAPEEATVREQEVLHDWQFLTVWLDTPDEEQNLLLRIRASSRERSFDLNGRSMQMKIGGMETRLEEQEDDGEFSGRLVLKTPLISPHYIDVRYDNLSEDERDLALQIVKSIRGHTAGDDPVRMSDKDLVVLEPRWDLEPKKPQKYTGDKSCRFY